MVQKNRPWMQSKAGQGLAARREVIFPVAVLVANLTVRAVNHELGALVLRNAAASIDGFPLRIVHRSRAAVACTFDSPAVSMRDNVLVLSGHLRLSEWTSRHIK